jgi:hypothetical protein
MMVNIKKKIVLMFTMILLFILQYSFGIEETIIFKKPFIVQKVKGIIKSESGPWGNNYATTNIVFKLLGPNNDCMIWLVKLDKKGKFELRVPQGKYKFTIEVCGWDNAEGTIIVTKSADQKSKIEIVLGLS